MDVQAGGAHQLHSKVLDTLMTKSRQSPRKPKGPLSLCLGPASGVGGFGSGQGASDLCSAHRKSIVVVETSPHSQWAPEVLKCSRSLSSLPETPVAYGAEGEAGPQVRKILHSPWCWLPVCWEVSNVRSPPQASLLEARPHIFRSGRGSMRGLGKCSKGSGRRAHV